MKITAVIVVLAGLLVPLQIGAVSILECRGADGKRFFSERCPPGSEALSEKKISTGGSGEFDLQQLQKTHPVVLYLIEGCDACDLMRNYLEQRGVPFSTKDVGTENPDNQQDLKTRVGQITVPVVTIGDTPVVGYNRPALRGQLDAAGYPDAQAPGGSAGDAGAGSEGHTE